MKVLLADKLSSIVHRYLNDKNLTFFEDASLNEESLLQALKEHQPEILVVRSTEVKQKHIEQCPSLALIIRAGAGVNTIDMETASKRGVFVTNCPGRNAIAVAELVFGHILNWNRHLYHNFHDFHQGIWNKKAYSKSNGLLGSTIAVIGTGAIGTEVIERAKVFGLNIKAWSRSLTPEKAKQMGVTFCKTPIEAAQNSDIVTVHLPAKPNTKGLLNKEIFDVMNHGALVINTSRETLLNEQDLLEAMENKDLSAGLDVFEGEPNSATDTLCSAFQNNPKAYVTHHIGASTEQATISVGQAVIDIIDQWNRTGEVINCVNLKQHNTSNFTLTVRHADKVGVLASILETLKSHGHNIQEMENIIFQGGAAACARIFLVGEPSPTLIETLEANTNIFACSLSTLSN